VYVKKVRSSILGGVDAELGDKTLIIGPSAGGKTSIVRSIELALAGGTSDLEGRDWVGDDVRLNALASGDEGVVVEAELDDGTALSFVKRPGSRGQHEGPKGKLFDLREVRDELTGSPERARRFLLGVVGHDVSFEDVRTRMPAGLFDLYEALAQGVSGGPTDVLESVERAAAKAARDAAREVKGAKKVLETIGAGLGSRPTEEQLQAALIKRQAADQRLIDLRGQLLMAQQSAGVAERRAQYTTRLAEVETEISQINAPTAADFEAASRRERALALRETVEMMLKANTPQCQVCGADHALDAFQARLNAMIKAIDHTLAIDEQRQGELTRLQGLHDARVQLQNALASMLESDATRSVESLEYEVSEATREKQISEVEYQKLKSAADAWDRSKRARAQIEEQDERAMRMKRLSNTCADVQKELVAALSDRLCSEVTKHLPDGMVFGIEDGAKFRFGLVRDGELHTALSGAETTAVMTAIGAVAAKGRKEELAVLIPEERAYDPEMLAHIMRGLRRTDAQVILTSTVRFKGKTPAGWTIVDLYGEA